MIKKIFVISIGYFCCLSGQPFQAHLSEGWYPKQRDALRSTLNQHDRAAVAHKDMKVGQIFGLIVPHAGYRFSGTTAAAGYRLLDKERIKRVIILAPSHKGAFEGAALPFFDAYQTPLGSVPVDTQCVQKLAKNPLFKQRQEVWRQEHSLEVQLPFIQHYLGDHVRIVPLIIGTASMKQLNALATTLKECIDEHTLIVVSSDFTHHGARFGYSPFAGDDDVQESIKKSDRTIIDAIMHKKARYVDRLLNQTQATVCGRMPIKLFKLLQEKGTWPQLQGELVDYKTSYAVTRDPINSVSYATIIFTKKGAK